MTGQQKEERTCTLQDHLILNKKEKGITHTKTGFKNHQRKKKNIQKRVISTRRPHFWTKKNVKAD